MKEVDHKNVTRSAEKIAAVLVIGLEKIFTSKFIFL
jgi:hypothetical protein